MKTIVKLIASSFIAGSAFTASAQRPNIVFIVADDMGYADCGVQGCLDIPTPNLDGLAKAGIQITNGYVTGAVCSPSRCALMTGRYQQRDGVHDWIRPQSNVGIQLGVPTIADYLKKAGYKTAMIGKWHLGEEERFEPLNRGFDYFYGFLGGARNYFPYPEGKGEGRGNCMMEGHKPTEQPAYTTLGFGQKAADFVLSQKGKNQPFFLYLAFNAVHQPLQAPDDYLARFDTISSKGRRTYAGMLSAMDDAIGSVLKVVQDAGFTDNTLICFISDNGGPITRNAPNNSRNVPLHGGKGETWEGGIRVPFFMKWNGHLPAGQKFTRPVMQMDLMATVIAIAGISVDKKWPIDGVDLRPFFTVNRQIDPHATMCWEHGEQWAIRQGSWKLTYAFPSKNAKIPILGLFDLSQDVGESNDLSAANPDKVKKLQAAWAAWRKDVEGDTPVRKFNIVKVNESL